MLVLALFFLVLQFNLFTTQADAVECGTGDTPQSTIIFWTDGEKLKAINIVFIPECSKPVGIVSVPVYTCLENGDVKNIVTLGEYYRENGREGITRRLEELFGTPIDTYISVDQKTLVYASQIIGDFHMAGVQTNLAGVFEGHYTGGPVNLQVEIRQLAESLTTPGMLIKLPQAVWIFTTQVETNVRPAQILNFYLLLKNSGPEILQKKAVPGMDFRFNNRKYRRVEPSAWSGVLKEVTSTGLK